MRTVDPRWQPGNFEKNVEAVDRLAALAAAQGATVSQPALAWLLTRGEHIVPIPGTRSPKRIGPPAPIGVTLDTGPLQGWAR
ncbi:hypothetical protein ADL28_30185 [Streptomyces violaceusniger]|uniref:NADP-dependent oxidoreductase domain-containing protein n=1 Tax=Streptomyces violaceusniger TaxID=68280 RepID=A0A0X3VU60_STRVO|nr:hypothetical protein ADL28_30185 [Streptomyces violaceusniger]